jgi:putative SOS response-associated peptidase YedK
MCGRFSQDMTWAQVHAFSQGLDLVVPDVEPAPSFNIAPTQSVWTILGEGQGAIAQQLRWGLIPSWARDVKAGAALINARIETVAEKPSFRSAWKARRCLVPASGYYEWRPEEGIKQPYWIHDAERPMIMFGGIWENWKTPEGEWLRSFAIITTAAGDDMVELHDRTPLMLSGEVLHAWLHAAADEAMAIAMSAPLPALAWHPVSRAVGNPRSNGPQLIQPIA